MQLAVGGKVDPTVTAPEAEAGTARARVAANGPSPPKRRLITDISPLPSVRGNRIPRQPDQSNDRRGYCDGPAASRASASSSSRWIPTEPSSPAWKRLRTSRNQRDVLLRHRLGSISPSF